MRPVASWLVCETKCEVEKRPYDETVPDAAADRTRTFEDLLSHSKPPLELLRLSKEFFKDRTRGCKKDSPEWQLAFLFYLVSILAAGGHHGKISTLTPDQLLQGINWALERTWLDPKIKKLITEARRLLLQEAAG